MKVFKFGGASVKSAEAVENVGTILQQYNNDDIVVVVSAMGKTTNTLEGVVHAFFSNDWEVFSSLIEKSKSLHMEVVSKLFEDKSDEIYHSVTTLFDEILNFKNTNLGDDYNYVYDQIVSYGEIISTTIVASYLTKTLNRKVCWKDVRKFIRTDANYRSANVDWEKTQALINKEFLNADHSISVTQGFIGQTDDGATTTLGREGSDYTAAIIAHCLDAESVTIWKDVPGMLNADPKYFEDTVKLDRISFKEAIELAYYGASVIHPKTIKPLQNKSIPLYIKSFISPTEDGSLIQESTEFDGLVPSYIIKTNQVLLSVTPKDFSFVVEENLSDIFKNLAQFKGHINVMQNSAVSFSVCLDIDKQNLKDLIESLSKDYIIKLNEAVELVTIRYYNQDIIDKITQNRASLMEQRIPDTVRIVIDSI
ncbi:MAG: aspartate kinase [Brumimicrobium sp.]